MNVDYEKIRDIIKQWDFDPVNLIEVLHDVQQIYNYLPKEALEIVSKELNVPLRIIEHVVTFYKSFTTKPRGKYHCQVCMGITCHIKGGPGILDAIKRHIKAEEGEVSEDGLFSVEVVRCVGACGIAPVVMINNTAHGHQDQLKITRLLDKLKKQEEKAKVTA